MRGATGMIINDPRKASQPTFEKNLLAARAQSRHVSIPAISQALRGSNDQILAMSAFMIKP